MGLNGKTPAKVAGIDMDLGENKLAGLSDKCSDQRPDYAAALGRLVRYVDVINEWCSHQDHSKNMNAKKIRA